MVPLLFSSQGHSGNKAVQNSKVMGTLKAKETYQKKSAVFGQMLKGMLITARVKYRVESQKPHKVNVQTLGNQVVPFTNSRVIIAAKPNKKNTRMI